MVFKKLEGTQPVVDHIASVLREHLGKGEKVTWLVCGGSSIDIAAGVSQALFGTDISKLTVTLTDERYGAVGHKDSNWLQLEQAGFRLEKALTIPVLTNKDLGQTVSDFGVTLDTSLHSADYKIALFGMGADGHIAGILPDSTAVLADGYATGYETPDFTRLTMTFEAIKLLDEAVLYVRGDNKLKALKNLQQPLTLQHQPAQIIKRLPNVTVYNDQIGEEKYNVRN